MVAGSQPVASGTGVFATFSATMARAAETAVSIDAHLGAINFLQHETG